MSATAIAKKDGFCCNCERPFRKGDPIRFVKETRSTNLDANNRSWTAFKPRCAHECRNAKMERLYLASVKERREQLRVAETYMRETIGDEAFEERKEKFFAWQAPKFAALDAEEAHIREHGHPYPECVK